MFHSTAVCNKAGFGFCILPWTTAFNSDTCCSSALENSEQIYLLHNITDWFSISFLMLFIFTHTHCLKILAYKLCILLTPSTCAPSDAMRCLCYSNRPLMPNHVVQLPPLSLTTAWTHLCFSYNSLKISSAHYTGTTQSIFLAGLLH